MTAPEFARSVVHGPGGMLVYEGREAVVYHEDIRVHAVEWCLRCLANPACPGSAEAVAAILAARERGGPGK